MKRDEKLLLLHQEMDRSCVCALKKGLSTAVIGKGCSRARIVFVGEAPGKQEAALREPFIGTSGKMLCLLLDSIGIVRDDIYITNIVKYRPPENRDPTRQEINDCLPWLCAEIAFIEPDLIVTLGRHALEVFVPDQKISTAHGQSITGSLPGLEKLPIYASYHPAAALYNGSLRETLFDDFARIPQIIGEGFDTSFLP